jgi:DNA repair protein RadA/Sms
MGHRGKALYATGEESAQQISLRAERLGLSDAPVRLVAEIELEKILGHIEAESPSLVVIDSIQTLYSGQLQSAPGTVAQVRECAAHLTRVAKSRGVSLIFVGHVTKEGTLAGPRVLEHMVDTVLYFEGEPGSSYRMVRAWKNRFGAANELGVFCMGERGLEEVSNPSSMFLGAHEQDVAGTCVLAALEGNRPFLVEVQALVEDAPTANPKRFSSGVDTSRLQMLLAVLAKHADMTAHDQNVYVKVVGGVRLTEPAADLAILLACHSSLTNRPLPGEMIVFGEVGLAGELRAVPDAMTRLKEAAKLGFRRALIPAQCKLKGTVPGMEVTAVARVDQALSQLRELRAAA